MLKGTAREAAAEFFGTFILITFGIGVVAQAVLSKNANGSALSINIAWGLAVMLGIYSSGGVSGAHLNPAVTIALAVHRALPWNKVAPYVLAQVAGAFAGAALVWFTYREALTAFDGGMRTIEGATATAGIFATYPQSFLSIAGGFVDQVVGTMLLMAGVLAVTDQKNVAPPAWLTGPLVGLLVVLTCVPLFAAILRIPFSIIAPVILVICAIGAYTVHNAMFDVWLMVLFGVIGYVFKKLDYPLAPLVLALVLMLWLNQALLAVRKLLDYVKRLVTTTCCV